MGAPTNGTATWILANVKWLVTLVAIASIMWFRVGQAGQGLIALADKVETTYVRKDVYEAQQKAIMKSLDRIELKLPK